MYQGTTPSIPITFEGVNLLEAKVYLSVYDERKKVLHTYESGRDFYINVNGSDSETMLSMSQEDTLSLGEGLCFIQGRWVFPDGVAGATQRAAIQIQSVLMKDVIEYGEN